MAMPVEPPLRRVSATLRPAPRLAATGVMPGGARARGVVGGVGRPVLDDRLNDRPGADAPPPEPFLPEFGADAQAGSVPVHATAPARFLWRADLYPSGWSVRLDAARAAACGATAAVKERAAPTKPAPAKPAADMPAPTKSVPGKPVARTRPVRRGVLARVFWGRAEARDPAPSRLAYRLNRLWLTPGVRRLGKVGTPVALIAFCIGLVAADPARRDYAAAWVDDIRTAFHDRPEFRVESMDVPGVSEELRAVIESRVDLSFPQSSFRIDIDALRASVLAVDAVRDAQIRITPERVLELRVRERQPAVVWRGRSGLELLDAEGRRIARLGARHARADLPLIAGEGAQHQVPEALALLETLAPLQHRVRGLVRIGERRWDVVLDRDQRILLPEVGAEVALEHVMALDRAHDLLARDLVVADLRNPARPVLRLTDDALQILNRIRHIPGVSP